MARKRSGLFGKKAKGRAKDTKSLSKVGPTGDANRTPWMDPERAVQQASAGTAGRRLRDTMRKSRSIGMRPPR